MQIQANEDASQVVWPVTDCHDVLSKRDYILYYRPDAHSTSKAYTKDIDYIIPSVPNGCMYVCASS